MNKNKTLSIALAALFTSSIAMADSEVTGKLIVERAGFGLQEDASGQLKNDTRIRLYADGDITDNATYHVEIQGHNDDAKVGGYGGEFTQNAGLREAYVDISGGDWEARIGKQQVVWGTADGMKLLDIINPTDYAEMAQDQMEDSRIPVWALNLEKGSIQAVISQPKENVFAGLNRGTKLGLRQNSVTESGDLFMSDLTRAGMGGVYEGTDEGNKFRMMGPETITGERNGFINITPDMGGIARRFAWGFGKKDSLNDGRMAGFTVDGFENMIMGGGQTSMPFAMGNVATENGGNMLCTTANAGTGTCTAGVTNDNYDGATGGWTYTDLPDNFESAILGTSMHLAGITGTAGSYVDADNNAVADSVVEANANATTGAQMLAFGFGPYYNTNLADVDGVDNSAFDYMPNANFFTFNAMVNAGSEYVYGMPNDDAADIAIKSSHTTKGGTNFSLNFSNSYDKNPIIDLSWRDLAGNEIYAVMPGGDAGNTVFLNSQTDGQGTAFGGTDEPAVLRFTQKLVKTKNYGGSFDTSFENPALGPVVIRGEALYTQNSRQPVIDKAQLSIGNLQGALKMEHADRMKFVLGVDMTMLTNMMVSAQYISDRNLDHIDTTSSTVVGTTGDRYTADYATMSLSNGFNKAIEAKNFYSLFFSKPFGKSGEHRWNNIFMFEEGDGNWNRFDVSWGLSDDVEGTFEVNNYWGEHNTQFGQLKQTSNIQTGLKYSF